MGVLGALAAAAGRRRTSAALATLALLATAPASARAGPRGAADAIIAGRAATRLEPGVAPILAASSDLGVIFGGIVSLARFAPGYSPYRWRVELLTLMTAKGGIVFQDHYAKLDLPGLWHGALRLSARAAFIRHSNIGYYGIGNASRVEPEPAAQAYEYDRISPEAQLQARLRIVEHLKALAGATVVYNAISVYDGSKLQQDLASDDPRLRALLRGFGDGLVATGEVGLIWDSRDHELTPARGAYHEVSYRFFPGGERAYGGLNLTVRAYHALYRKLLVVAWRVLFDMLVGQPPLYELARHGGTVSRPAPGGDAGVRGLPLQRYHGKVKLLGNLELRAKLWPFALYGQRFNLGLAAFWDTGRGWTGLAPAPRLDGEGVGLKHGVGGGLRLQWGETFLIRADLAWSPDADPIAFYINASHAF